MQDAAEGQKARRSSKECAARMFRSAFGDVEPADRDPWLVLAEANVHGSIQVRCWAEVQEPDSEAARRCKYREKSGQGDIARALVTLTVTTLIDHSFMIHHHHHRRIDHRFIIMNHESLIIIGMRHWQLAIGIGLGHCLDRWLSELK